MVLFFIPPSVMMVMSPCIHSIPFGWRSLVSKDKISLRKVQHKWGAYLHGDHLSNTAEQICSEACWNQQSFQLFSLPLIYYTGILAAAWVRRSREWRLLFLYQPAEKEKPVQHRWGYWLWHLLRNGWFWHFCILVLGTVFFCRRNLGEVYTMCVQLLFLNTFWTEKCCGNMGSFNAVSLYKECCSSMQLFSCCKQVCNKHPFPFQPSVVVMDTLSFKHA